MFVGKSCAGEDPQPDTSPSQLWFAVKRAFLGLGGEPLTLIENSWGGWAGTIHADVSAP